MRTKYKAILLIILSAIGYIIQLHYQTQGVDIYNSLILKYTINSTSGILSILTSSFMHGNTIHILMNMFMLYMLSTMFIERKSKLMTVYLLSGLLSGIFSMIYVHFVSDTYVLGASGAIFGLFSYIFFRHNRRKEFYLNFFIFNIGMFVFGMNIAWYGHLGGAIAGILFYYYENDIMPKIKRNRMRKI